MLRLARLFHYLTIIACLAMALPARAAEEVEPAPTPSGLPVPRFVALKSDEVNVRTGPGTRYPIAWVYKRQGLPVEIVDEFDQWRKLRDYEGATGWVHKGMVDGRRSVLVKGGTHYLMSEPTEKSAPTLRAQAQVIGKLLACEQVWCRIQIAGRKGWMKKSQVWGVYDREVFE